MASTDDFEQLLWKNFKTKFQARQQFILPNTVTTAMPSRLVDTATFGCSADPQLSSPFFTILPAEIRNLIYLEVWNLVAPRLHVVKNEIPDEQAAEGFTEQWGHVPCCIDLDAEDIRFDQLGASEPTSSARSVWGKRLKSEWCLHWPCEERGHDMLEHAERMARQSRPAGESDESIEANPEPHCAQEATNGQSPAKSGFLDILTACKRMYLECLPSLYANTTFVLTDTRTAEQFLSTYSADVERYPIRSLEISIRVPNLITEIYYPPASSNGDEGPPAIFAGRARPMLSMRNNPWQHLCDRLVELPNVQDLRIWLDSSDLRPWHKRVSETRFFGRLLDVRVPDKRRFVLGLPELPERRGPDSQVLQDYYLEGDKLDNVPFTLERGERPNNWRVHLRSIVGVGGARPRSASLTAAPHGVDH